MNVHETKVKSNAGTLTQWVGRSFPAALQCGANQPAGLSATRILSQKVIFEQEIDNASLSSFFFFGSCAGEIFQLWRHRRP